MGISSLQRGIHFSVLGHDEYANKIIKIATPELI